MANYNATVVANKYGSISLVEVDAEGRIVRCAGWFSPLSGKPEFDAAFRQDWMFSEGFTLHLDGGAQYKARVAKMGLL
mgnify:CR=1 FL=1|jgi:hypothetical protein